MNGYKLLADSYRKLVTEGELSNEEAASHIKTLDFLSTCSHEDIYHLFDSSAFNDIAANYFKVALHKAGIDDESSKRAISEYYDLLGNVDAQNISELFD